MFIPPLVGWVKSLANEFKKPGTNGSTLEAYILSKAPKDVCDVDRLIREFDYKNSRQGSFPC